MNKKKNEINYFISVTFSEPQIIDMRKVFFIENKELRPARKKSHAPALRRTNSKQSEEIDNKITSKMQKGESFENILNEILDDKEIKINIRTRRNKSFCLEDFQKP